MTTQSLPISGWFAPARAALETYRRTSDHILNIALPYESFATGEESRQFARLANRAARARAGVFREWTLSPFWLSGLASPADLRAELQNAVAIDRDLAEAWDELVRSRAGAAARDGSELATVTATAPATELNTLAVDAVRTAALSMQALGQPGNLNAAAVAAVHSAAISAAAVEDSREFAVEMLDEAADIVLAGAQAATNAAAATAEADAVPNSGVMERTGESESFEPSTAVSAAEEASKAAAASRRTARKANGKPA